MCWWRKRVAREDAILSLLTDLLREVRRMGTILGRLLGLIRRSYRP